MQKISRNEPCPCGSGKKYKKCCGLQKTVSITAIVEKEIEDLQADIIQFAMDEFDTEIDEDFHQIVEDLEVEDEEEMEFYLFLHTVWFLSFVPVEKEKTILQIYIEENSKRIQRPRVKDILQTWVNPRPIAGKVLSADSQSLTVQDTLTKEMIQVKLLESLDKMEDTFIFGILVPYGEEQIFFTTPFDSKADKQQRDEKFIHSEFASSGYADPIQFLKDEFIHLMSEIPFVMIDYGIENFEWKTPIQKHVALLYENQMLKLGVPSTNIALGTILWYKYCEAQPRLMKKPETYAAAIHFLNMSANPITDVTKKEIAQLYGVSPSTLGTAISEMELELREPLMSIKGAYLEELIEALEESGLQGHAEDWDDEEDEDIF